MRKNTTINSIRGLRDGMVSVVDEMRSGGREAEVFAMVAFICVPSTFLRKSDDGHVLERWSVMASLGCSGAPRIDATISRSCGMTDVAHGGRRGDLT